MIGVWAGSLRATVVAGLLATPVLVVLPVTGGHPTVWLGPPPTRWSWSPATSPVGPPTPATAVGPHGVSAEGDGRSRPQPPPELPAAGGDTQYNPSFTTGVGPSASDFTQGYDASWGQLENPGSGNYLPGLVVRPTPGDHEYGDASEDDRGPVGSASSYYANFGPSGLDDLPTGVSGPSSDFYGFDVPVGASTWHIISLDGECAALPSTPGGGPSRARPGVRQAHPKRPSCATT